MVTSGRGPSEPDIRRLSAVTRAIKEEYPELEICVSLGIMNEAQARERVDAKGREAARVAVEMANLVWSVEEGGDEDGAQ